MAKKLMCAAILVVTLRGTAAPAAQPPDGFDACAAQQDPAARVACFDHALAVRRAAQSSAPATGTVNPDVGLDARQARKAQKARGETPRATAPAPISARVVRIIPRQPLIEAFELDNGQIWEQSESMKVMAQPQEPVTIRRGTLGAFFLKTAEGTVVRVHRVR